MTIFLSLAASAIISFFATPVVIVLAKTFGLVDDPRLRPHPAHTHTRTTPRAGGLVIFVGIVAGMILFIPITKMTIGIMTSACLLMLVGLADDKKDVNPYLRLVSNIVAALVVVGVGAGIPYITNPITGGTIHLDTYRITFDVLGPHSIVVIADLLAIIWILWTTNIVGWSAGVDGQMPGFVAIAAFVLGILSLRYSSHDPSLMWVTVLAFIVCGAHAGFLPWNFYPQKIMPGYGGKTLAGFFLALLGILSFGKLGTALLVLGIPMADALYTLIRRISGGKSPVRADRGHLHHRLLDLGWGRRKIALFYWGVSAILGSVALLVNSRQKLFALLLVGVVIGGFLVWINFFSQLSKSHGKSS